MSYYPGFNEAMAKLTDREEAVQAIESLYPSDSKYADTAAIGKAFMQQAMEETEFSWRDLPEVTLIRYAKLCTELEFRRQE